MDKRLLKNVEEQSLTKESNQDTKDSNTCMALGLGVGSLGAASALLTGAVCPLCIFIAPGLVGLGVYRRWRAAKTTGCISN